MTLLKRQRNGTAQSIKHCSLETPYFTLFTIVSVPDEQQLCCTDVVYQADAAIVCVSLHLALEMLQLFIVNYLFYPM